MSEFSRSLVATVVTLLAVTPSYGQSDASCIAYMEADAIFGANPAVRDSRLLMTVLSDIGLEGMNSDRWRALIRAINSLLASPSYRKAAERRRLAYLKAYKGPVSADKSFMAKLLLADRKSCKDRFGD